MLSLTSSRMIASASAGLALLILVASAVMVADSCNDVSNQSSISDVLGSPLLLHYSNGSLNATNLDSRTCTLPRCVFPGCHNLPHFEWSNAPHEPGSSAACNCNHVPDDPKQLKQGQIFQEEAATRDHRKVGLRQELFFFHPLSPGSAFWYPKGAHIYNKLVGFIRQEYRKRGFKEVITPNVYNAKLLEQSGHWQHYAEDMFRIDVEKEQFALKPMNCPGHCLMFAHKERTHAQLPIRYADFGVLHRNELSTDLTGLTRVRRFQQDDAHIFCRPEQVGDEIRGCLDFLDYVYAEVFGFSFELFLSTRPVFYLGDLSAWNLAEDQLKQALDSSGFKWKLRSGDGAFYGPKIDIRVKDALNRSHQCATIQLDFQLPQRFNLQFYDENQQPQRPVLIHRAILGSLERMTAILTENFAGKWPFWLSPRQAMIIAVHKSVSDYAREVYERVYASGFEVEFDEDSPDTLNKRIRNAQLEQFNFILVVGQAERDHCTVNVRTRDNQVCGEIKVDDLIANFRRFADNFSKDDETFTSATNMAE